MKPLLNLALCVTTAALLTPADTAHADSIRLTNGDTIRGEVTSLNEKELVIESDNFGQMKIPREKVDLIALGDTPLEERLQRAPASTAPVGPTTSDAMPSMQNPQVQQQVNRLLQQALGGGFGGIGTMQQDLQKTQRGLKDLQRDLGPGPSADALDGYIKMFEMFGGGAAGQSDGTPSAGKQGSDSTPSDN
ncbi:hypothetical protein FYK55_15770 [Roseiconus nitratireducens]|uniref:Uncharacterized protein n=1 Tax=Roseiconus nitratireducens TaxID=2605748 RepID=A0A5M6D420_9BACT|nr:hypothetical protein [Roseiconus nitratireducens]KAA5542258.1 hypothetical protein FYK55_15770 [Roseiconus nitratireducens]